MERQVQELTPRINALSLVAGNQEMRSRSVLSLEKEMSGIKSKIDSFTAEKKQPMKDHLDPEERDLLLTLNTKERELQQELETTEQEVITMTVRTEALKHDLADNLTKRKVELEQKLSEAQIGLTDVESTDFADLSLEKENAVLISKNLQTIIDDIEAQVLTKRSEKERLTTQIEEKKTEEVVIIRSIEEATKMHDKLMNKRTMMMDTIRNKSRAIRDLGTLPRAEAEVVKNYGEKQLMERLSEVQESLKKFPGVNRKALDQYVLFNEQRETLNERKGELTEESKSIQKLVDNLDIQKEEAILRTFKGVSHHFSQVFSELVATGKGQLIMRTSDDEDAEGEDLAERYEEEEEEGGGDSDEDEEGTSKKRGSKSKKGKSKSKALIKSKGSMPSISTFRGVQVRVSFSGDGPVFEMKQLSGGQKALVALALIFAIQRCDPAPFYLFDEIDQALDASYRAQVARLIHKQAHDPNNPAQFITTTFRPEMVDVADKHYGIALVNKASNIYPLNKSDATNFVTNMMLQEESVGEVTRVATYAGDPRQRSAIMDTSANESRAFDETVLGGEQGFDESKISSPAKKGKKDAQEEETEDVTKFEIEEVRRPLPATTAKADEQSEDEEEDEDDDDDDDDENLFAVKNRKKGSRGSKRKGSVKA
jgi:structural maintenance of chromosome 3 (chondroitin sulfate proteoglycan 6)